MPQAKRLLLVLTAVAAVCAFAVPSAFASTKQVTIMQDNNAVAANPTKALTKMKQMGVTMVKYAVYWKYYTPNQNGTKAPAHATDPSTYTPYLTQLDAIDQAAQKVGIKVGFMVTSPAPRWAEGSTKGCVASNVAAGTCRPNTADFKAFMTALGERYNGSVATIPAVRWWSIWNEPNYEPNLMPQLTGATTYTGADLYRGLVDAAWSGLTSSGHRATSDTILFGEVAPRGISGGSAGQGPVFNNVGAKPIGFIDALYCETTSGRRQTGAMARANGCSGSAAAFKKAHPALFNASGFADHPYSQGVDPNVKTGDCNVRIHGKVQKDFCPASARLKADPYWTDLASIGTLTSTLARDTRAYGDTKNYAIWNTEYGFWTAPPGTQPCSRTLVSACDVSQANQGYYMNWAEYLSYKNSRIASLAQYQLYDPSSGQWTDGLLSHSGKAKPGYAAYEMPLFLPTTTHAGNLTVWGGVRPAAYELAAVGAKPQVHIQYKGRSGGWKTVKTVTVSTGTPGSYFTTKAKFPAAGSVRLAYLAGRTTMVSRTQIIK